MSAETLRTKIEEAYTFEGANFTLGTAMFDGTALEKAPVRIPIGMLNRHGLIAGATGTGKTKTLQIVAEQLSRAGVPSLLMDIKGDLSGLAAEGKDHPKIQERHAAIGEAWKAFASPVEFLSLSKEPGVRLRATITEFGPVLLSKILGLNDNQGGVASLVFKYCDDWKIPLLDLADFKKTLQYLTNEGKEEIREDYGTISKASTGAIMRRLLELEQQGAKDFFGEPSFDIDDLMRKDGNGHGICNIIRLTDMQDRPKLFATFMLQMMAEVYASMPERGDADKPELVIFIDEAHLVFKNASRALQDQLESIIKLIRSKGVGIIFITQNPADIPEEVLGQCGMKIQHALRAFTAKDRKAIKLAAQNFPISDFYKIDELLTQMGIGEAMVSVLDRKGRPTELVHTLLRAPASRMDILTKKEIAEVIDCSELIEKYNQEIDRESAYEILTKKIEVAQGAEKQAALKKDNEKAAKAKTSPSRKRSTKEKSTFEKVYNSTTTRQIGRTIAREVTRGILGVFGIKTTRSRRKKSGWFS
jgi:DNA helicase HerA-like ATPase